MDSPTAAPTFTPYGLLHWAMLVGTVIGAVLLVRFEGWHRGTRMEETFTRVFAIVQFAVTFGFMILWLIRPFFDLHQSLPLHLSDVLRVVAGSRALEPVLLGVCADLLLGFDPQPAGDTHPRSAARRRAGPGDPPTGSSTYW